MADASDKINSNEVLLAISTNLDTPDYKDVVCGQDIDIDWSKDITTLKTKCGTVKAAGEPSVTITGTGVANHTPGGTEISADEIAAIMQGSADVLVRVQDDTTPANYYRQGQGTMTAYSESAPLDGAVTFDFTIEVSGSLDLASA
jgi:predicted secreted protein